MLDLLSLTMKRKFELLYLLESADAYVDLQTIAWELSCSERTAHDEIEELKQSKFSKYFSIFNKGKDYMLVFNPGITIDIFTQYVLKENAHFQIIELTLYRDNMNVEKLAKYLHTSVPTTYRYINSINEALQASFNISLSSNPCRLHGDEVNIRSFYTQYMSERYLVNEWPFDNIDEDALVELIKIFSPNFLDNLSFSQLRNIKLGAGVSMIRYQNDYQLEPKPSIIEDIYQQSDCKSKIDKIHKEMINKPYDGKMAMDVAGYFINKYSFNNYQELSDSLEKSDYTKESVELLTSTIESISEKFNMPILNFEDLLLEVHNAGQVGIRKINARQIISQQKSTFINTFKSIAPSMYEEIKKDLRRYVKLLDLDRSESLLSHLTYTFVTHWENLLENIYRHMPPVNIKVVSTNDQYHAEIIKQKLEFDFDGQVEVSVAEGNDLKEILSDEEADIIITNFSVPFDDKDHIFAINDLPTAKDMRKIMYAIHEVQHEATKYL